MMAKKKGSWSDDEKRRLSDYMVEHPETRNWEGVANAAGLNRSGKSCRMRWINYHRLGIKKGNISKDEHDYIISKYKDCGPQKIAGKLGRAENEIKNHFHTHMKKKPVPKHEVTPVPNNIIQNALASELSMSTVPPKLHPDDLTRNPQLHGLGFNPTLPAQNLSSLPPQRPGHFNHPAMEDTQSNNNHLDVDASWFPSEIDDSFFEGLPPPLE